MRVVSIVGARPQFVKLAPVAKAFAAEGIDHKIIHTGQHYDVNMSDSFFIELGIPNPDLHLGVGGGSHGLMTGRMLEQLDPVLEEMAPDWVLVYGDTNSTIAGTLSAVKMHLPVAHLEAGLRSFNRRMPEEHNRVLTDHAADLCLAPTEVAMGHLADEGLAARSVLVGDVMTDVCLQVRNSVLANPRPVPGVKEGEEYVMATIHRADNTDDPERLAHILDALGGLDRKVILPVHPRLRARAEADGITIGLQKEAFLLGTICTTVRTETEWVETVENGWNVLDPDAEHLAEYATRPHPEGDPGHPYGDGKAAANVAKVLLEAGKRD